MKRLTVLAGGTLLGCTAALTALASSHSDAPRIKQDAQANLSDVYAFIGRSYANPEQTVLNVAFNTHPFSEPGDGAQYERFADDARYSVHITDPNTGTTAIRYDFYFTAPDANNKNVGTILAYGLGTEAGPIENVGDNRQNFSQFYRIEKVVGETATVIGDGLIVAPPNVGGNTTPYYNNIHGRAVSGAWSVESLDRYTRQSIFALDGGAVSFAGPRDDSFYADAPGIFDLLNIRILDNNGDLSDGLGQDGNGVDGFRGFNVLTCALQIPIEDLSGIETTFTSAFFGEQIGVGVYASVSRPKTRTLNDDGTQTNEGWFQVNRLANPLFNEAFVPVKDKDKYNRTAATIDPTDFSTYAENPELAFLINFVIFGTPDGQSPIQTTGRADLVNVYMPDVIRVNTTTDPVRQQGEEGFSRLGFIGGDTTNGTSGGWPNGRRFGDDVVDIALTALVSGPTYSQIVVVGDNIAKNDLPYNMIFPYAATPHAGANNTKDSECFVPPITRGDMNCDGSVDFWDIDGFVLAFMGPEQYSLRYPDCNILSADIDQDNDITWDDIDPFVDCVVNEACQ